MKSDLRNLHDAELAHFNSTGRFTPSLGELPGNVMLSQGVSVAFERLDSASYRVVARHEQVKEACFIEPRPGNPRDPDCEGRFKRRP